MTSSKSESVAAGSQFSSFARTLFSDTIRIAPGIIGELLGGFGVSLILGQFLPATAMGLFTLFWLFASYTEAVLFGWLQNAVVRFLPGDASQLRTFLTLTWIALIATGVIGFVGVAVMASVWRGKFDTSELIWTVAIFCAASLFDTYQGMLRGVFDQWCFSASAVLLAVLEIGLLAALLSRTSNLVNTALMALALSYLPIIAWQVVRLYRYSSQTAPAALSRASRHQVLRRSLGYGLPLSLSLLALTFLQTGDRYILTNLVSLREIGLYTFWMSIGLQFGRGVHALIFAVLNPRLFQLHELNPGVAHDYLRMLIGDYVVLFLPLVSIFGCLVPPILELLHVRRDYISTSSLVFFGLGMAFLLGLAQLCGKTKEFESRTSIYIWAAIVGATAMVGGTFGLVPLAGLDGAANATLFGFGAYFFVIAISAQVVPAAGDIVLGAAAGLLLFLAFRFGSRSEGLITGGVSIVFATLCYAAMLFVWRFRPRSAIS